MKAAVAERESAAMRRFHHAEAVSVPLEVLKSPCLKALRLNKNIHTA